MDDTFTVWASAAPMSGPTSATAARALRDHRREQVYSICGNHDRSGKREEPARWWRKWVDPTGAFTERSRVDAAKRPHPLEGI